MVAGAGMGSGRKTVPVPGEWVCAVCAVGLVEECPGPGLDIFFGRCARTEVSLECALGRGQACRSGIGGKSGVGGRPLLVGLVPVASAEAEKLREAMGTIELLSGFWPEGSADQLKSMVRPAIEPEGKVREPTESELSRQCTAPSEWWSRLERPVENQTGLVEKTRRKLGEAEGRLGDIEVGLEGVMARIARRWAVVMRGWRKGRLRVGMTAAEEQVKKKKNIHGRVQVACWR